MIVQHKVSNASSGLATLETPGYSAESSAGRSGGVSLDQEQGHLSEIEHQLRLEREFRV